jgi:hypothetical protein
MKRMLLGLALLLTATITAFCGQPTYCSFAISPGDVTKVASVHYSDGNRLQLTLSPQIARAFAKFSERNIGNLAVISLIQPDKVTQKTTIDTAVLFIKEPITSGILTLALPVSELASNRALVLLSRN